MSQSDNPHQASRRSFLRGRFSECKTAATKEESQEGQKEGSQIVDFLPQCLALQGVMCRTCADRCDEGAIVFQPQLGGMFIPLLSADQCTGCGDCIPDCPNQAVRLVRVADAAKAENLQPNQEPPNLHLLQSPTDDDLPQAG